MHGAKTLVKPCQTLSPEAGTTGRTVTVVKRNQAETTKCQSNKGEPGAALANMYDQTWHHSIVSVHFFLSSGSLQVMKDPCSKSILAIFAKVPGWL